MKNFFKNLFTVKGGLFSTLDEEIAHLDAYIQKNKVRAEENLKRNGWTILSTNTRLIDYGYKIQKNDHICRVSLDEALRITSRITARQANPEGYSGLTRAIYKGKVYDVIAVDFDEDLVAIEQTGGGEPWWKRIESYDKIFNEPKAI